MKDSQARKTADQAHDAIREINKYLNKVKPIVPIKQAKIGDYINFCGEPYRVAHLSICRIPYASQAKTEIAHRFALVSPGGEEHEYVYRYYQEEPKKKKR